VKKEKMNKKLSVVVQQSLYQDFETICHCQYRTTSEVIRELMLHFIEEHDGKSEQQIKPK
jgi:metal-responsive CopG/Arc/MetJ family transcriptional regulator